MNDIYLAILRSPALRRLNWRDEEGATAAEYALLISMIAIAIIGSVTLLGQQLSQVFSDLSAGFPAG